MQENKGPKDWLFYEKGALSEGFQQICGIDEVGRGPLAGPVFASAVILPVGCVIPGVNDSKKLSPKKREELFDVIKTKAVGWAVGFATEQEIDEINILQATFLAMRRAVEALPKKPDLALVDGNRTPFLGDGIKVRTIIKGDGSSESIAAASIMAKVSRDRLMIKLDELYPEYGFARNKGYGTAEHVKALLQYGPCPIHRTSFLKKILGESNG
ncbi:MAG: ribonuclease HII [Clostridiales bacterium]|jgi:ribonuclease HII|nr:ribonuclease HII [Clostridiales bacterium]MCI2161360.1 ribonuclease HII [Oscillospiraceae bacterium]MCI1960456.1 ribonuclease HII [Clostridiales bacterium]MCI2020943.1 ribonuclease HII [Clostridiales bacterium]MCI2025326.1 ribonuclease HII [Clostridiales bacterium]